MGIAHKACRILLGIIVISLVVPFSPPVSLAKAKICCKNKCSKMMRSMANPGQNPVNHCNHQKNPVNCCKENCSKILGYEKPDRTATLSAHQKIESVPLIISFLTVNLDGESKISQSPSINNPDFYLYRTKNPPIFITHSSLII